MAEFGPSRLLQLPAGPIWLRLLSLFQGSRSCICCLLRFIIALAVWVTEGRESWAVASAVAVGALARSTAGPSSGLMDGERVFEEGGAVQAVEGCSTRQGSAERKPRSPAKARLYPRRPLFCTIRPRWPSDSASCLKGHRLLWRTGRATVTGTAMRTEIRAIAQMLDANKEGTPCL